MNLMVRLNGQPYIRNYTVQDLQLPNIQCTDDPVTTGTVLLKLI